jgi:hypothetical protein
MRVMCTCCAQATCRVPLSTRSQCWKVSVRDALRFVQTFKHLPFVEGQQSVTLYTLALHPG